MLRFVLAVFLMDYHSGQGSRGYRILCKLNPRNFSSELCEEMRQTPEYDQLVYKYAGRV
jgi:hypothetical protein